MQLRAYKTAEYVYGALHPEQAVSEGLDVKYPSDLPIPTGCIRVSQTVPITTGANGNVFVNYIPGGLLGCNVPDAIYQSTLNVNTTTTGTSPGTNSYVLVPYLPIAQVYDRWRLVAAEMRVEYTGTVLNESGMQYSCVHYENQNYAVQGVTGTGTIAAQSNVTLDRLSGNISLIKTGLWNEQHNVTKDPKGRTHLFTPDTPVYTFNYRLYTTSATTSYVYLNNQLSSSTYNTSTAATVGTVATDAGSNSRQYCWFFTNLPANNSCLTFQTYEIYEFIPDIAAVAVLKLEENLAYEYMSSIKDSKQRSENNKNKNPWSRVKDVILNRISHFGKNQLPKIAESIIPMLF